MDKCLTVSTVGEYIHVFTNFGWYNKELNLSKWNKSKDINIPHIKSIILKVIQDKEISFSKSTGRKSGGIVRNDYSLFYILIRKGEVM